MPTPGRHIPGEKREQWRLVQQHAHVIAVRDREIGLQVAVKSQ